MQSNTDPIVPNWICPSCKQTLEWCDNAWRCVNKHSFDRAKEGYVNLLLAQQKSSKDPGDNKDMVSARRAFLEQGHYLPLANKVAELINENKTVTASQTDQNSTISIYDAGCGEGYYLASIQQNLMAKGLIVAASGSDISKPAIQKAAKKYANIDYAVASSFKLPVASDSQDVVIQIFAPSEPSEIQRILKKEGLWLRITPASHHLFELKEYVYELAQTHEGETNIPTGFELLSTHHLQFSLLLSSSQQRESLLMMTPFYWTISAERKKALLAELNNVSADFDITVMMNKKM